MSMTAADIKVMVGAEVSQALAGLKSVDQQIGTGAEKASKASIVMGTASAGIFAGFGLAARGAMNYEAALNSTQASLGLTKDQMEPVGQLALKIGQDTQFSATQGAQAIEELGKAGVALPDILNGAAMSAAQLASATGVQIPMAANVMANAMNTFGLSGKDATRVADVMTAALNASSLDMNDFAQGMASAGSSAAALGIPIEDTSAALALFSNRGMSGADAGTSLRSMLTALAGPTDEARARMQELGISAFDAQGNFVGMENLAGQLQTQLAGLSDEQRMATLKTIFGADAQRVANILYEEGADGVAKMTDQVQSNGQAQAAAAIRMQGLSGALEQLKGSVETAFISFGELFLPVLTKVALGAAKLVNGLVKLSKPIKAIILGVGAAVGVFGLFAGGLGPIIALAGPLAPLLMGITTAIGAMLLPFILITAAVIGLYLAYKNNFLGIGDIVDSVVDSVKGFIDTAMYWVKIMGLAYDSGLPVKTLLAAFPAPLQDVAEKFLLVADSVGDLVHAYQSGGFDAMLDMLPGKLKIIGNALKDLAGMGLRALWDAFTSVDWGGIAVTIMQGLYNGLVTYWPTVAGWLGTVGSKAVEAMGNLLQWAVPRGIQLLSGLLQGLINHWPQIRAWLATVGSMAVEAMGNLLQWAIPRGMQLLSGLLQGMVNQWPTVKSWLGTLGSLAIEAMGNLLEWAVPRGIQLISGLLQGAINQWPMVSAWLMTLGSLAVEAMGNFLEWAVPRGIQLISGLLQGAINQWPTVQAWLATLGQLAIEAIGNLLEWAIPRGIQLIAGLLRGAVDQWPTVTAWLATLGGLAVAAIGNLASYLLVRGQQLIDGLWRGAQNWWDSKVVPFIKAIPGNAKDYLAGIVETLVSRGNQLISGFMSGIEAKFRQVAAWLKLVGEMVRGNVGDLGGILKDAGIAAIQGLYDGIYAKWQDVQSLVSSMGQWIKDHKGPVQEDYRLLQPAGLAIMAGLDYSLRQGWQQVQATLAGMGAAMSGTMLAQTTVAGSGPAAAATVGGRGATIVYNDHRQFTVDVDSLEDVATAVDVIHGLRRDHELVYGAR